ncbi:hypothetical protein HMPREF9370_0788 [Neisseria wadsworthii 9715]|uniref:Uncharacterized protein n=1 Tax=Neisseria wadsworthii 9715 TaxID=1030841 RepID=G4CNX9_9NEIS|nr:hypothetical protein HMPREF9370_0788 [Neisseria wadsworthii 9715]
MHFFLPNASCYIQISYQENSCKSDAFLQKSSNQQEIHQIFIDGLDVEAG